MRGYPAPVGALRPADIAAALSRTTQHLIVSHVAFARGHQFEDRCRWGRRQRRRPGPQAAQNGFRGPMLVHWRWRPVKAGAADPPAGRWRAISALGGVDASVELTAAPAGAARAGLPPAAGDMAGPVRASARASRSHGRLAGLVSMAARRDANAWAICPCVYISVIALTA